MANISRAAIKQLVSRRFKAKITDNGVEAIARMLELEAERIAKFAVENARKEKREKVTGRDIERYIIERE
jgi:histone H3/H4